MRCHARLTKWTTRSAIGEGKNYALQAYVCTGTVNEGLLCTACMNRSTTHVKYEQRIHGLLTEPIPENSHIYGGSWYWRKVATDGEPPADWILSAKARQAEAEQWVEGAWSPGDKQPENTEDRNMVSASQKQAKNVKQKTTDILPLTKLFPPKITPIFKEVPKSVSTLSIAHRIIVKGVHNGVPVWVLPDGKMMHMDEQGEPKGFV